MKENDVRAKAFAIPLKAVISGRGDEAVDLAKTSLWC
jgi:hypothetical protein